MMTNLRMYGDVFCQLKQDTSVVCGIVYCCVLLPRLRASQWVGAVEVLV